MKANRKLIKKDDHIKHVSELSVKKSNLVILGKIFASGQPFDVNNDFLAERLTEHQLSDFRFLLNTLEDRKADWRHHLQVLEYIADNLDLNSSMEPFYEEENFQCLITAWDDRSNITKAAAELFPSVFDETANLIPQLLTFFVLIRNGGDTIVATIAIMSCVAEDCDPSAYYELMEQLRIHTIPKSEKHEVVRAGCISCAGYVIYDIKQDENNPGLAIYLRPNSSTE